MFWHQYRKTALYVQLTVLVILVTLAGRGTPWPQTLAVFVVMELASFVGTAWALRLRRKAGDLTLLQPRSTKY